MDGCTQDARTVIRVYNTDMATLNTQTMLLSCEFFFFFFFFEHKYI